MPATRTPAMGSGDDQAARQAASDAAAAAANARQMVLNRDPTLQSLQDVAATAAAAIATGASDRADLRSMIVALQQAVGALPTRWPVISSGQGKTTTLLALGSSADVPVTLSRTMPNTTYNIELLPISAGLLPGAATITVKSQTKTTVTLSINAVVAVAAASVVSVVAWG